MTSSYLSIVFNPLTKFLCTKLDWYHLLCSNVSKSARVQPRSRKYVSNIPSSSDLHVIRLFNSRISTESKSCNHSHQGVQSRMERNYQELITEALVVDTIDEQKKSIDLNNLFPFRFIFAKWLYTLTLGTVLVLIKVPASCWHRLPLALYYKLFANIWFRMVKDMSRFNLLSAVITDSQLSLGTTFQAINGHTLNITSSQ